MFRSMTEPSSERPAFRAPEKAPDLENKQGHGLDGDTLAFFESRFGRDLSGVKVHHDADAARAAAANNARAYTIGDDIVFAAGEYAPAAPRGRHLLAHELTHVVQQRRGAAGGGARGGDSTERDAARAADRIAGGGIPEVREAAQIGIARQTPPIPTPPIPTPQQAYGMAKPIPPVPGAPFNVAKAWSSSAEAAKAMATYRGMAEPDRRTAVEDSYQHDLAKVLAALSKADQTQTFVSEIREIVRWVEEIATRAKTGMTDDQMAQEQADFTTAKATAAAQAVAAAAAPKDAVVTPPTPAQIGAQQKAAVKKTSIAPPPATTWWSTLKPAEQAAWTTRGNAAIAAVVAYAKTKHPELDIKPSDFNLQFEGVEKVGASVLAAGHPALIGKVFVETVEINPAYVMDVVVHEVFGHPEYGTYGQEYHMKLYDKAAAKTPGYVKPAEGSADRNSEIHAFAYQETEIYALLRSMQYRTPAAPADAAKVPNIDTQARVTHHMWKMKNEQWSPKLINGLVYGLRQRLKLDPRITAAALAVFDAAVKKNFDAAAQAEILK